MIRQAVQPVKSFIKRHQEGSSSGGTSLDVEPSTLTAPARSIGNWTTSEELRKIIERSKELARIDEKLMQKKYRRGSPFVYGSTSYERMRSMLEELNLSESDIFVDLGCGLGQAVMQVAAGSGVKRSVGVELAKQQSTFARALHQKFQGQLVEQGKRCNEYELHLEQSFFDASLRDLIVKDATVVLINNLVFPEVTDEHIKKEFISEMADGTRIVSTRAFATRQRGVNARNVNDVSSILKVSELKPCTLPAASWTAHHVPYYLHVVDRTMRDEALAKMKAGAHGRKRKLHSGDQPEKKTQKSGDTTSSSTN